MHPQAKKQKKSPSKSTNTTKKAETNTKQKHFRITVHTENVNAQAKNGGKQEPMEIQRFFLKMKLPSASQSDAWKLVTGYPVRKF